MTRENEQAVKSLYNQGMNPEDIADELGLDETEVMDYCAEILGD
jgi:DNA-binding transcriptional regulator LsrR (DeoR family)